MAETKLAEPAANDSKYVSTTKGVQGGYLFVAPVGTALPTGLTGSLDAAFKNAGYISEDGFTESVESDAEDYKDMNGDVVDSSSSSTTETIALKLLNMDAVALGIQYGSANVSEDESSGITVKHNWSKAEETLSCVLELVLKNGRRWRKVVPSAKVTERGEFTGSGSELAGREVTLSYLTDAEGCGCIDYIAPVTA